MSNRLVRNLIIIFVVVLLAVFAVLPDNPVYSTLGIKRPIKTVFGLDLQGGVQALLEADLPADQQISAEAMGTAVRIVENRVNPQGVGEAIVQQAGERRIVVELPGEIDPETALSRLKRTGLLEFVDFSSLSGDQAVVFVGTKIQTDYVQSSTQSSSPITDVVTSTASATVYNTVMTGAALKTVAAQQSQIGEYEVTFELNDSGKQIFSDYTSAHIGDVLAIVLDKEVISTPSIRNAITDGRGAISGNFNYESANELATLLRYGSLPIPLKIVESRTVGPTLGQDSLRRSEIAGLVGFTIVMLFMALYYRLPGLIADVAILIYAVIAFALYRSVPVTLTLAGIAGFLLSTGSALDANILIFERFKEELRAGRNLATAVDLGFKRAWPSIRDSNIATLITCAILFWFGSTFGATIVKGFSLTLFFGVLVSLFTALFVTRTLLSTILLSFRSTNFARWFGI